MAAPVWVLSVDLQAKTATFQSGMAEAARAARGSFGSIGTSAASSSAHVAGAMLDVRHSIGLVDNVIRGAHAQAMADLIRMFSQSRIVMAALPLAATAGGIALIGGIAYEVYEKIHAWREEQEKLQNSITELGTTANQAFNNLDEKILSAQIAADNLSGNHLAALHAQLKLIDMQSMADLLHQFETIAKAADAVFGQMKDHWYELGIGSAGAAHALGQFKVQYNSLLAQGKDKQASDLLAGTLASAKQVLAMQKQAKDSLHDSTGSGGFHVDYAKRYEALNVLKKAGVGYSSDEVKSQQALVDALEAQEGIEQRMATLKGIKSGNATRSAHGQISSEHAKAAKESADSMLRMGESAIAADKATADARLTIQHASIQARLTSDLDFAQRQRDIQEAANKQQIAALDKLAKDYPAQLKALEDKALEIEQQYQTRRTELISRASVAAYDKQIQDMESAERQKIAATENGSRARLAAIDSALNEELAHNMQATSQYRSLLQQRAQVAREMQQNEARDKDAASAEAMRHQVRMGEMQIAAAKEQYTLINSARRVTDEIALQQQMDIATREYQLKQTALAQQIALLDKNGKDYDQKLKALQDREKEMVQAHENEITAIKQQATERRNRTLIRSEDKFNDAVASGLTRTIMAHQSFAASMASIGNEVVSGMIQTALKSIMANDMTKESDAAKAARAMFIQGTKFPFPANIIMAPTLGAMAFASVMAFQGGTDRVPGVGRGDIVPAMLEPGEGVVPRGTMDRLNRMSHTGDMGGGVHHHQLVYSPTIHNNVIDGDGLDAVLTKHADVVKEHFETAVRHTNR